MESRDATYWDRVTRLWHMLDVRTAFATDDSIRAAQTRVAQAAQLPAPPASGGGHDEAAIVYAKRLVAATIHPDTGEIVRPAVLRLSCIVPMNCMLDSIMLSARGLPAIMGAQWLNQTYNALHYYANRNASNHDTSTQRWAAYTAATGSSVLAAVGVTRWGNRLDARSRTVPQAVLATASRPKQFFLKHGALLAKRGAPMAAVASADLLNVFTMRCSEFLHGVNIYAERADGEMERVGKSKMAGLYAVSACTFGRVVVAMPILSIPPAVMVLVERSMWGQRHRWVHTPLLLSLVAACIMTCVPLVFGIFRQTASCHVRWLEPEFRDIVDSCGDPVHIIRYNKGL